MKLKQNNNIVAIITAASLITIPTIVQANNKIEAYYDEGNMNIREYNSYTLRISKEKLEELLQSNNEELINIKISNEEVKINREELLKLKKQADQYEKENLEYSILIIVISGALLTTIILKDTLKEKYLKKKAL